jgi:hypothetical protein
MKTKPEIKLPTEAEIPALTDRVAEINAEIQKLSVEKKGIEARLEAYALAHSERHEPLKDDKREGRRMVLSGARHKLPIVFASDLIIQSFRDGSDKHKELIALLCEEMSEGEAPKALKKFFEPPSKWENLFDNGVRFRAACAERLPKSIAAKFISACTQTDKAGIKKSNVSFDYKAAAKVDGQEDA